MVYFQAINNNSCPFRYITTHLSNLEIKKRVVLICPLKGYRKASSAENRKFFINFNNCLLVIEHLNNEMVQLLQPISPVLLQDSEKFTKIWSTSPLNKTPYNHKKTKPKNHLTTASKFFLLKMTVISSYITNSMPSKDMNLFP